MKWLLWSLQSCSVAHSCVCLQSNLLRFFGGLLEGVKVVACCFRYESLIHSKAEAAIWTKDADATAAWEGSIQAGKQLRIQLPEKHSTLMTCMALCASVQDLKVTGEAWGWSSSLNEHDRACVCESVEANLKQGHMVYDRHRYKASETCESEECCLEWTWLDNPLYV